LGIVLTDLSIIMVSGNITLSVKPKDKGQGG